MTIPWTMKTVTKHHSDYANLVLKIGILFMELNDVVKYPDRDRLHAVLKVLMVQKYQVKICSRNSLFTLSAVYFVGLSKFSNPVFMNKFSFALFITSTEVFHVNLHVFDSKVISHDGLGLRICSTGTSYLLNIGWNKTKKRMHNYTTLNVCLGFMPLSTLFRSYHGGQLT